LVDAHSGDGVKLCVKTAGSVQEVYMRRLGRSSPPSDAIHSGWERRGRRVIEITYDSCLLGQRQGTSLQFFCGKVGGQASLHRRASAHSKMSLARVRSKKRRGGSHSQSSERLRSVTPASSINSVEPRGTVTRRHVDRWAWISYVALPCSGFTELLHIHK
jgi:hypothetical protein